MPEKTRIDDLPENVQCRFRHAELWKTLEVTPGTHYAALDATEALRDIEHKGYHIAGASIQVVEEWSGKPG